MIIDSLKNLLKYRKLIPEIESIMPYVSLYTFNESSEGKTEINSNIFFIKNEYETGSLPSELNGIMENHRVHMDIQCVLSGDELIEYERLTDHEVFKSYNTEGDVELFHSKEPIKINAKAGDFVILFPGEIHMPGRISETKSQMKKLVFKLKVDRSNVTK